MTVSGVSSRVAKPPETCRSDLERRGEPLAPAGRTGQHARDAVAIIGMSCLFPGAPDLDSYWRNILGKVDAVTDPPPEARETGLYFEPNSREADRVYCKRGGYLGSLATFDPLSHGIPPVAVGGEPDQWLALQLARDALADAGYVQLDEPVRKRTAVILGKGTYLNAGNAIAVQHGLVVNQTLEILKTLHPEYTEAELEALRRELKAELPPFNAETMPGLVPNVIVGRIANRLDLMGPTYTVDAACASSLVALRLAVRDLRDGECDLALAGGSQVWIPMPTLSIFCQLGALSPKQRLRPFDSDADGTLLGEGIGMLVLKRLRDAELDGDRIYAVIRGVGIASDGRGASVMAPRVEGEEMALRRAYEAAGVSPRTVGLIEAHGTGIPLGDLVEVEALSRVFGPRDREPPRCALGSVKSMISHTIPAAGVAGTIKAALALYHKVLPPTLNCDEPNPRFELEKTPFYVNTETRPWIHGGPDPRRAGVNAFGFGGINAHVLLEEYTPRRAADGQAEGNGDERPAADRPTKVSAGHDHLPVWECEVCSIGAESAADLLEQVTLLLRRLDRAGDAEPASPTDGRADLGGEIRLADLACTLNRDFLSAASRCVYRLALVATSVADLRYKLDRAAKRLAAPDGCRRIQDVSGIYFAAEPLLRDGKLAFLFPGEGSQYPSMLADLCLHFPEVRECFDQIDRVYFGHPRGYVPSDHIFPRPRFARSPEGGVEMRLFEIAGAVEAVLTANQAVLTLMRGLGLQPDVIVGHSTGEFSALRAAGIFDPDREQFFDLSLKLYRNYEEAARAGVPRAVLLAVGAERERVEAIAREAGGELYVAMDNCPHQVVLVGEHHAAERALEIVRREGLASERLNFDRAYHTPLFAPYVDHLRQIFEEARILPARIPIYSCTTAAPYPHDPAAIRELMVEHWLRPVQFRRTVEALYEDGVRAYVEVGPRGNLTAFIEDILRGRRFCAVPANVQRRSGLMQLHHLVAILTAHGANLDLMYLYRGRRLRRVARDNRADSSAPKQPGLRLKLNTGFPAMRVPEEFARRLRAEVSPAASLQVSSLLPPPEAPPDGAAAIREVAQTEAGSSPQWSPSRNAISDPVAPETTPSGHLQEWANRDGSDQAGQTVTALAPSCGSPAISMVQDFLRTMEQFLVVQQRVMHGCLPAPVGGPTTPEQPFPLLGDVVSWVPGVELVARRTFDPADDLYLRDHTLGRGVSDADPNLLALAVMPLAMSIEILAEAAAFLSSGRTVVGVRDVRAYRWIAFDDQPQALEVRARQHAGDPFRVDVELRNLTEDCRADQPPAGPVIAATVVLADSYPQPSPLGPQPPRDGRRSRLRRDRLYSDYMFHGTAWQAVASVEQVGDDGSVAVLRVLPSDGLLRDNPNPRFVLDPVVLDAAGQVIGFWTAEQLATGKVIFPFRLEALEVYGPRRPAGTVVTCVASIRLIGDQLVRSDIDVIADGGLPWFRLIGWEDKRFELPAGFHQLMQPARQELSQPWPEPVARLPHSHLFECRKVPASLRSDRGFWQRVWAQRVLSRAERAIFRGIAGPESEQLKWLAGRTVAKEAARQLLRSRYGLDLPPAEIEIDLDLRGRSTVGGSWTSAVAAPPVVSIAYVGGMAVAVAGLAPRSGADRGESGLPLGVHIESEWSSSDRRGEFAFTSEEIELLHAAASETGAEWVLRGWCAKEAVAAALAADLPGGPRSVAVVGTDPEAGAVFVQPAGPLAAARPDLLGATLVAFTSLHDGLVVAATFCEFLAAGSIGGLAVEGALEKAV
jgi:acyl transferase domain-containing protein